MQDGKGGNGGHAPSKKAGSVPNATDSQEEEDIPTFHDGSQSMAMFVPLEESLFEPFSAPKTNLDRLKIILENVEKHTAAVQENIRYVYEREHRRILQYAKKLEAAVGVIETDVGLTAQEERIILNYVHAPIPPGANYTNRHLSTYSPPNKPRQGCSPREGAILWSLYNTGQELVQIVGYNSHARSILNEYNAEIAKEIAAIESQKASWTGQESELSQLQK